MQRPRSPIAFAVWLILVAAGGAGAGDVAEATDPVADSPLRPGATVLLRSAPTGPGWTRALLLGADDGRLLVQLSSGSDLQVPWSTVRDLKVRDGWRSAAREGLLIGASIGATFGAILGWLAVAVGSIDCEDPDCEATFPRFAGFMALGAAAGSVPVGGAGALVGSAFRREHWEPVRVRDHVAVRVSARNRDGLEVSFCLRF